MIKDTILHIFFRLFAGNKISLPSLNDEQQYLTNGAFELARMIRNRKITSHQLTLDCLNRLNQVNPIINAIADGPFNESLNAATEIDIKIKSGEYDADYMTKHPLLGVPFTTKESIAVKGKSHTLGLISRKNKYATDDAECIKLIKNAGGLMLATTNIPEMNIWQETRNNIIGQTNNPYDTRRTVGGSSGGEAAAIAACGSPFGVGTDMGGSTRMPAFYCGLYGHKPSSRLIKMVGCTLRTEEVEQTMTVACPMCRDAFDLRPLLGVNEIFGIFKFFQ